ncbi:MAG: hypothetical protein K2O65_07000, partial [Lachnospiraceae bacterium]|nr:hypothetical protein [Lachnospiraceae bacterium]
PEVEAGYMTLGDWIDIISEDIREDMREEVTKEVREEVTKEVREEVTEAVRKEVTKAVTKRVTREVQEQDIRTVVEMFQEYHETKENAVIKIRNKFPEYADSAEELLEKYWQDCTC